MGGRRPPLHLHPGAGPYWRGRVIAGDPSTKINKYLYVNLLFPLLIAEIAGFMASTHVFYEDFMAASPQT